MTIDREALEVTLYGAYARTASHNLPAFASLSREERRRWCAVAELAHKLLTGDPSAPDVVVDLLAGQAGAYPWQAGSRPPAPVEPEAA